MLTDYRTREGSSPGTHAQGRFAFLALLLALPPGLSWSIAKEPPQLATTEAFGTLTGTLVDGLTGQGVVGAEVQLTSDGTRAFADLNGHFSFGDRNVVGPDTIVIRHLQYDSLRLAIEADDLGPLDLEIHLDPRPIPIEGLRVLAVRTEAQRIADLQNGRLWKREDFESFVLAAESAVDPLRWAPGVNRVLEGANGARCVIIRARHGCAATYVNGMLIPTNHLVTLPTDIIDSYVIIGPIEAELVYGRRGAGGVVLIYTKR